MLLALHYGTDKNLISGGFRVTGKMSTLCCLSDPITGHLTVDASVVPIQSIDLHLLRTESVLFGDRIVTETSLVQTTQVFSGSFHRPLCLRCFYKYSVSTIYNQCFPDCRW